MPAKINILNKKFGRLFVLKENGRKGGRVCWDCQCDCGAIVNVRGHSLRTENTVSCGCYRAENNRNLGKVRRKRKE